jgi:hypothetical protein
VLTYIPNDGLSIWYQYLIAFLDARSVLPLIIDQLSCNTDQLLPSPTAMVRAGAGYFGHHAWWIDRRFQPMESQMNNDIVPPPDPSSADGAMEDIFLARQPILDRQQRLVAYELLFRSGDTQQADITEHMRATTTVVHNAFNGLGIVAVLGHAYGYINVDDRFLLSDLVEVLPSEKVVLEIPEFVEHRGSHYPHQGTRPRGTRSPDVMIRVRSKPFA